MKLDLSKWNPFKFFRKTPEEKRTEPSSSTALATTAGNVPTAWPESLRLLTADPFRMMHELWRDPFAGFGQPRQSIVEVARRTGQEPVGDGAPESLEVGVAQSQPVVRCRRRRAWPVIAPHIAPPPCSCLAAALDRGNSNVTFLDGGGILGQQRSLRCGKDRVVLPGEVAVSARP